eukprot:CAMPEP_0202858664 /NCGR_PEP_ID=MMETSP1391-20130828/1090_1 /ASSEMBLY_ACC=CAM_ASM_000867 /TAXON_ID=1034604 /ORGANISM="Chlamydomonas leiostraca, Strain SAG 11-49" /LENGTH=84 /DNA_ID=CAMNT_0049537601 /DNA_START=789 /DNA_END=1043 /DNA_ORIENTATION=+
MERKPHYSDRVAPGPHEAPAPCRGRAWHHALPTPMRTPMPPPPTSSWPQLKDATQPTAKTPTATVQRLATHAASCSLAADKRSI